MNGKISDEDVGVEIDAIRLGLAVAIEPDLAGRGERTFRIGQMAAGEGRVRRGRA